MGVLKKAENTQAFLKAGLFGFAGSGKTYTATMIARALAERDPQHRPVAFVDTEAGSDYMIPKFREVGVELIVSKSRAFKDLLNALHEAEASCSVLIVDSITHIWRELMKAYKKRFDVRKLKFHHWDPIKDEWQQWTDGYLNSQLHTIVCGRGGWNWNYEEDDEGDKELVKTGTKMKAENEFGFEPSLLLEMVRIPRSAEPGAGWVRRCYVLKDRTDRIDGRAFDNPDIGCFEPVLSALNVGGKQLGVDTTQTSEDMFDDPGQSRSQYRRKHQVALQEIEETAKVLWPSTSGKDKVLKVKVLERIFGTKAWTAIQGKTLLELQRGVAVLQEIEQESPQERLSDLDAMLEMVAAVMTRQKAESSPNEEMKAAFGVPETPEEEPTPNETGTVDGALPNHSPEGTPGAADEKPPLSEEDMAAIPDAKVQQNLLDES